LGFSRPKNIRFEDQIETFPFPFWGLTFGKILSLLETQENPIVGVVSILAFFVIFERCSSIQDFKGKSS
jgi:hypothetical protein